MKKIITLFIGLTFGLTTSFAQNSDFISVVNDLDLTKSKGNLKKFDNMNSKKSIQIVKLGNITDFIKGKKISFKIPGYNKTLKADITLLEAEDENNYKCFGRMENDGGDLMILCEKGKITAHISVDGRVFQIYYNDDNTATLIERDAEELRKNELGCNVKGSNKFVESKSRVQATQAVLPCQSIVGVRVLCLVTQAARLQDPNYVQTVNLGVQQFNSAAINSNTNTQVRLINAGVLDFNFVEATATFNPDINDPNYNAEIDRIITNNMANNLRNQFAADVIVLVTNAPNYSVAGFVRSNAINTNETNSYAIANITAVSTQFTLAHEVGHLLGGRHNIGDDAGLPNYARGHTYSYRNCGLCIPLRRERDIMAIQPNNTPTFNRVIRFSNPLVSVGSGGGSSTTGTATNNVVRRFNEYLPTVAAFRPERLTASISGPTNIQTLINNTWEANVSCGGLSYTYQWAESTNGVNYTNISGATGMTFSQIAYPNTSFAQYKRVTVSSNFPDGKIQIITAFIFVSVQQPFANLADENFSNIQSNITISEGSDEILTYPNPILTSATVDLNILSDGPSRLDLMDDKGNLIKNYFENNLEKGKMRVNLRTDTLKEGIYYLKLSTSMGNTTTRLAIK
jgi:hypothetical protein